MKFILLAAFCALSLGSISRHRESEELFNDDTIENFYRRFPTREFSEKFFSSGREYRFFYDGQILTGIPGSSRQHSGSRIQAMVVLQFRGGNVVLRLDHVRFAKLNQKVLEPRAQIPFELFERIEVEPRLLEQLKKPVKFAYSEGLIRDIVFERTEESWSANIKRGVLNLLQVNLKQRSSTEIEDLRLRNALETEENSPRFFRVNEKTLEGECEVLYEIENQPSRYFSNSNEILNVTKSINLDRCEKRPEIKYNWRQHDFECPTCDPKYAEKSKYLKASSVLKFNISGTRDNFLIESAKTESQYVVVLFNEESNIITTYVNNTLVLYKSLPISSEIQTPSEPTPSDSGLVYTLDWEISRERFETEGDREFLDRTISENSNKVEIAAELLRQLTRHVTFDVEIEAPRVYNRLVSLLRLMTREQLEQIHRQFYLGETQSLTPEEKLKIKDLKPNLVALCGTENCLTHLFEKIVRGEVPSLRAANALRQLQLIRTVSKKTILSLERLCEEPVVRENFFLKQSCYLSLGSMLRALCVEEKDKWAVEVRLRLDQICPRDLKEKYVQLFIRKIRESPDWETKVLMLKSLNNAGLDLSIFELAKIIENVEEFHPTFLRLEAIAALRHLIPLMPQKIQKILMPIYMNRRESPVLRMAAVEKLIETKPERTLLEIITKNLQTETSLQVASFAYSYLQSLANTTNPCHQKLAADIKLALRFTREINPGLTFSKYVHASFHDQHKKFGFDVEGFQIFGNTSIIPRVLGFNLNKNMMGYFQKNLAKIGLITENLEPLFYKFFGPQGYFQEREIFGEILRRSPRDLRRNYENELREIYDELRINPRAPREPNVDPKAYLFFSWLGQELGFIPFSTESIRGFADTGYLNLLNLESRLRQGIQIHTTYATLLDEAEFKIPTTLGFPLRLRYREPLVSHIEGQIRATIDPETRQLQIRPEVRKNVAVKKIIELEHLTPIVSNGLIVNMNAKVHLPIEGEIKVDLKEKTLVHVELRHPEARRELVVLESEPLTFVRRWPETLKVWTEPETRLITGEEHNRVATIDKHIPLLDLRIRGRYHWTPFFVQPNTAFYPLSGPNRVVIYYEPREIRTESTIFEYNGFLNRLVDERITPTIRSWFFDDRQTEEEDRTVEDPYNFRTSESRENLRERSRENLRDRTERQSREFEVPEINEPREHGFTLRLKRRVAGTPRPIGELTCGYKHNSGMEFNRFECQAELTELPREYNKIVFTTESVFPSIPFRFSEVEGKRVALRSELRFGQGSIVLKAEAKRSQEQRNQEIFQREYYECRRFEDESIRYESPIECEEYLNGAGALKRMDVEIDYQNVPIEVKNVTRKLFNFLKDYVYFWNTDVAEFNVRNPEGKIRAIFTLDHESRRRLNVTVKMPQENVTMIDIPVPVRLAPLNIKNRFAYSFLESITEEDSFFPVCRVKTDYIETFDGRRYSIPLTTCYSVLAKDCTEENRFVVMMKKLRRDSEEKRVKILTRTQKIELEASPEDSESLVKVWVNDEPKRVEDFNSIVHREGPKVRVELPEEQVEVHFDGYSAKVRVSPLLQGRQCGICGHFDREPQNEYEFLTPDFEPESDVRRFFHEYQVKGSDENCEIPENYEEYCDTEECRYEVPTYFRRTLERRDFPLSSSEEREDYRIPTEFQSRERLETSEERRRYEDREDREREDRERYEDREVREREDREREDREREDRERYEDREDRERFGKFSREDEYYSREYIRPRRLNKIIERQGKVCFSRRPVKVCPQSISYDAEIETEIEVPFVCFRRSEYRTFELISEAERIPLESNELQSRPVEFSETVQIPEKCRRF